MAIRSLQEKFAHEIRDIYDAEHQFLEAMQQQRQQARNAIVQQLLTTHIAETQQQIRNLEQVFQLLGEQPRRETCMGGKGIVSEGKKLMEETRDMQALLDLAIAGGDSKVEHYEIASYRGLIAGAQASGQQQIAQLLQRNLQQEEQTAQLIEQSLPVLLQQAAISLPGQSSSASATM